MGLGGFAFRRKFPYARTKRLVLSWTAHLYQKFLSITDGNPQRHLTLVVLGIFGCSRMRTELVKC